MYKPRASRQRERPTRRPAPGNGHHGGRGDIGRGVDRDVDRDADRDIYEDYGPSNDDFSPLHVRGAPTPPPTPEYMSADSIPLEPSEKCEPRLRVANLKLLLALFVIFVVVVSDVFTSSCLSSFGEKAVRGRDPTSWGVVLQGIFLVIFYIIAVYLTEHQIL